jgi:hypothetical protein
MTMACPTKVEGLSIGLDEGLLSQVFIARCQHCQATIAEHESHGANPMSSISNGQSYLPEKIEFSAWLPGRDRQINGCQWRTLIEKCGERICH